MISSKIFDVFIAKEKCVFLPLIFFLTVVHKGHLRSFELFST